MESDFRDFINFEGVWKNCSNWKNDSNNSLNETSVIVKYCDVWKAAQHNLFQTANIFFAAAFLVPKNFKQNMLLVRVLLTGGFLMSAVWSGFSVCGPDILFWSILINLVNFGHTLLQMLRILPPHLSIELTDLYLKQFKPLKVGKKHFKELAREGQILQLSHGATYASEDITHADEKLSILLKGKLKVTCDKAHLHFIYPYQFIDSPEWEATHETSDDDFQVTIRAEEECFYLCWPRLKLERILRHRTLLRHVFECMIGKDITHKLYSLNEHLRGRGFEYKKNKEDDKKHLSRSLSADAVNMGVSGLVRSFIWISNDFNIENRYRDYDSSYSKPNGMNVVASQFPADFPFLLHSKFTQSEKMHHSQETTESKPLPNTQDQLTPSVALLSLPLV